MTDDLIARLKNIRRISNETNGDFIYRILSERKESADALEEKDKSIAKLEEKLKLYENRNNQLNHYCTEYVKEITELSQKCSEDFAIIDRLKQALKPFADEAGIPPMPGEPDDPRRCSMKFLKAAKEALEGKDVQ